MDIKEAVVGALQELILPELAVMQQELGNLDTIFLLVNQRLDAVNQRFDDVNMKNRRCDVSLGRP